MRNTNAGLKGWPGRDVAYTLVGQNRLAEANEGTWGGSSISDITRFENWSLTQTGNWAMHRRDLNNDSDYTGTNEVEDTRDWNTVNEITARDTNSDSTSEYVPVYNKRGDLIDELGSGSASAGYKYEYDAFGRLRKIKNQSNALVSEYLYDALGRRVGWHYDADADADVDGSDPWY